jgi:hypothetical protein
MAVASSAGAAAAAAPPPAAFFFFLSCLYHNSAKSRLMCLLVKFKKLSKPSAAWIRDECG